MLEHSVIRAASVSERKFESTRPTPSPFRTESLWSNPLPHTASWVLLGDSGRIEEKNLGVLCAGKPTRAAKRRKRRKKDSGCLLYHGPAELAHAADTLCHRNDSALHWLASVASAHPPGDAVASYSAARERGCHATRAVLRRRRSVAVLEA